MYSYTFLSIFAAIAMAEYDHCEEPIQDCDEFYSFNDLACMCFNDVQCELGCAPGTGISPFDQCTCLSFEDEIVPLFPDWATLEQIYNSYSYWYWPYPSTDNICAGEAEAYEGFDDSVCETSPDSAQDLAR